MSGAIGACDEKFFVLFFFISQLRFGERLHGRILLHRQPHVFGRSLSLPHFGASQHGVGFGVVLT
jgi:hypothetical protein